MELFLTGVLVGMNTTLFIAVLCMLNEYVKEKRKETEHGKDK